MMKSLMLQSFVAKSQQHAEYSVVISYLKGKYSVILCLIKHSAYAQVICVGVLAEQASIQT